MSYISLHAHTDFSNIRLLDSINKINTLIDHAHRIGLSGVAITDHEVTSAHVKAIRHLKNRRAQNPEDKTWQNFKLVLGNEIYLTRNGLSKDNFVSGQDRYYHFILLAKDEEGHRQIRQLSSRAWRRSFYRFMERVPTYYSDLEEIIGENPGHVIASTACLGGRLPAFILEADKVKKKNPEEFDRQMNVVDSWIEWMIDVFGRDNFFLEKQPSLNKEQWIVNKAIEELAAKHNLKTIITTDAHYLEKEDRPIHKAYLNAKQGDREVDDFYATTYLMNAEEIMNYFLEADKLYGPTSQSIQTQDLVARDLANTISCVGAQIEEYDLAHSPIIPHARMDWTIFSTTDVATADVYDYEFIQKFIHSSHEQDRYFITKVLTALKEKVFPRIEKEKRKAYYKRINIECQELWNISEKLGQRLSAYQLLIADIIDIVWDEGDSLVGAGRGSSSGFLTNYLLGIVQVDPLTADIELPHWRST